MFSYLGKNPPMDLSDGLFWICYPVGMRGTSTNAKVEGEKTNSNFSTIYSAKKYIRNCSQFQMLHFDLFLILQCLI